MKLKLLVLCGVLGLLAGCAVVPISGPVERHLPGPQQANPGVDIAPVPPAPGAAPALIIEGFLHAMASYQPGYPVARKFLTPEAAARWRPEAGVEIYAGGYPPQASEDGAVLTAPLVGTLDPHGSFTAERRELHHDFGLVRDAAGEWRISDPPRGLLVSESLFGSSWVRADVCFWDVSGEQLVPDPRFVPVGMPGLLGTVRAILDGPSRAAGVVYRGQLGVAIQATSVTVEPGGLATVELTGEIGALSPEARRRLAAELVWSLSSLGGIAELRVRGDETHWQLAGSRETVTTDDFTAGAPRPGNLDDGAFLVSGGDAIQRSTWAEPGVAAQLVPGTYRGVVGLAVRQDGQQVGVLADGGTQLRSVAAAGGPDRGHWSGSRLVAVRWSRQGELWAALRRSRAPRLWVARGTQLSVDSNGFPPGQIRSFALAPDGVRVAAVIEHDGQTTLGVALVLRRAERIRFVGWRELAAATKSPSGERVLDVGWTGPATLLVLLGGGPMARVVSVDSEGAVAAEAGPIGTATPVQLATGASGRAVLRAADGQTWRLVEDHSWAPWWSNVQAVALP